MRLGRHFQGQKVKLAGAGAYSDDLPHNLFNLRYSHSLISGFVCLTQIGN